MQSSPNGGMGSDEGTTPPLGGDAAAAHARVRHCDGGVRLAGQLPPGDSAALTVHPLHKE